MGRQSDKTEGHAAQEAVAKNEGLTFFLALARSETEGQAMAPKRSRANSHKQSGRRPWRRRLEAEAEESQVPNYGKTETRSASAAKWF